MWQVTVRCFALVFGNEMSVLLVVRVCVRACVRARVCVFYEIINLLVIITSPCSPPLPPPHTHTYDEFWFPLVKPLLLTGR